MKFEMIPETRSPPDMFFISGSAYDEEEQRIIFFGMKNAVLNTYDNKLYTFSLTSLQWGQILPTSDFVPSPVGSPKIFIRSDRMLFSLLGCNEKGFISNIFSFNLTSKEWKIHEISSISGLCYFASVLFTYNSQELIAIYGGFSEHGESKRLFFFDTWSLVFSEPAQQGTLPFPSASESLAYMEGKLYMFGCEIHPKYGLFSIFSAALKVYDLETGTWTLIYTNETNPALILSGHHLFAMNSKLYIAGGFSPSEIVANEDLLEIDPKTAKTTKVQSFSDFVGPGGYSSLLLLKDSVIFSGGRKEMVITNEILKITFPDLNITCLSPFYTSPRARKNHAMSIFSHFLYVFGGETEDSSYFLFSLNDLWRFDLYSLKWTVMSPSGTIPEPRIGFAFLQYSDMGFIIFGGRGRSWYNELYFYSFIANIWDLMEVTGDVPGPRSGTCLVTLDKYLILFTGGLTPEGTSDQMFILNSRLGQFFTVTWAGSETVSLMNHQCIKYQDLNGKTFVNFLGGEVNPMNQNLFKVKVQVWNQSSLFYCKVSSKIKDTFSATVTSYSSAVRLENYALVFFGSYWGLFASNSILRIELNTGELNYYRSPFYSHSQSVVHFNRSFYLFGGCFTDNALYFEKCFSNNLIRITFEESDNFTIPCSQALKKETCEFCPKGTYLNQNSCIPCGKGKYSNIQGIVSPICCSPCEYGKYSDDLEATQCRICAQGYTCMMGTHTPKPSTSNLRKSSNQPENYESDYKNIGNNIVIFVPPVLILALFSCILFKRFREYIIKFDIFLMLHPNNLNKPIIYRKTQIGGFFSLAFVLICCYSVIGSLIIYLRDNIYEIKGLVPIETIQEQIFTDFLEINVNLLYYGGKCSAVNELRFLLTEENLKFQSKRFNLEKNEEICSLRIFYSKCEVLDQSSISIISLEDEAYCSIITVNITSDSSIPGKTSSIFVFQQPSSTSEVFRGFKPSQFEFVMNPSLFLSESTKWPSKLTGYHISDSGSHSLGSTYSQKYVITHPSLRITLKLVSSLDVLVTQRKLKFTWFLFSSTVLGSVFGIMQLVGMLMTHIENCWEVHKKRQLLSNRLKNIIKNDETLKVNFDSRKEVQFKESFFENMMNKTQDTRSL